MVKLKIWSESCKMVKVLFFWKSQKYILWFSRCEADSSKIVRKTMEYATSIQKIMESILKIFSLFTIHWLLREWMNLERSGRNSFLPIDFSWALSWTICNANIWLQSCVSANTVMNTQHPLPAFKAAKDNQIHKIS